MATHYGDWEEFDARSWRMQPCNQTNFAADNNTYICNQLDDENSLEVRLEIAEARVRMLEDKLAKISQLSS
jgi:hypothetical protein